MIFVNCSNWYILIGGSLKSIRVGVEMDDQDPVEDNEVFRPSSQAPRKEIRRKGVNLLRFLLPGKLRGLSAIVLAFSGIVGLSVVILFLVALIAFIVKRSGESVYPLPTVTTTPIHGEKTVTATLSPSMPQVTEVLSPTLAPVTQTPAPSVTAQPIETKWMKVTDTGSLGLRLRNGPGLSYETAGVFGEGTELQVIDGPQEADGIQWWKLKSGSGEIGWAAGDFLKPVTRAGDEIGQ